MKMDRRSRNRILLLISLLLCAISMFGTWAIQNSFGDVEIKTLLFETISGHTMSAKLFRPKTATSENPAPTIVAAHGWYNNKEFQDFNGVEFSRRGYVVLTFDMYAHGNSENLDNVRLWDGGNGMYDAVAYMATLPYVDADKIMVTGHSAGSNACSKAVVIDNERGTNLIKACLLMSYDPVLKDPDETYTDTYAVTAGDGGTWNNIYGNRDVGLIAAKYDDYFFTVKENGFPQTATRDYIQTDLAKAFLTFGDGPDAFEGTPVAEQVYSRTINGKEAHRVIYTPTAIHTSTYLTRESMENSVEFFDSVFSAPTQIDGSDQVWMYKQALHLVGFIGFFMFLAMFAVAMLESRTFEALRAPQVLVLRDVLDRRGILWTVGTAIARTVFSCLIIFPIMRSSMYSRIDPIWQMKQPFCISFWAFVNGLFAILTIAIWYYCYAKKKGFSFRETGLIPAKGTRLKTIGLAALTIWVSFGLVFFADYFFKTDFRFWQWSVKVFGADKLLPALPFALFFVFFYIVNSICINVQSFNNVFGKHEWVNILLMALFNVLSCVIIVVIQYSIFASTGMQLWGDGANARIPTWMTTAIPMLFVTPFIARKIYKETGNPYIGGIINGLMVTLSVCMSSTTITGTGL